jgi:hypothetical protein
MKKMFLILILSLFLFLGVNTSPQISFAATLPEQVRVVHNFARIFSTSQNLEILSQQELDQVTIKLALLDDVFNVTGEEVEVYIISFEHNQENTTGYIFKSAVIDNSIKSPEIFLQTNATVTQNSSVYKLENEVFEKVENITLEKGSQVRLQEKMSSKNTYTLVSFNHNGQRLNYYVETQNLKPNGVSRAILTAITLIFVSVSAGGILLGIFKRNNKSTKTLEIE